MIKAGGSCAALRDAQQRAHAELLHLLLVEHFAVEALFGRHRSRTSRQRARRQQVRRFVDQVAREILRFRQDPAALAGTFENGIALIHQQRHRCYASLGFFRVRLEVVRFVVAEDGALCRCRDIFRNRESHVESESKVVNGLRS